MEKVISLLDVKAKRLVDSADKDLINELSNNGMPLHLIPRLSQRMSDFGMSIEMPQHLEAVYNQAKRSIGKKNISLQISLAMENKIVEFEPRIYSMYGKGKSIGHDVSLQRGRIVGYQRHPLPSEIFNLNMLGLENKLSDNLESLYKNICGNYQEIWLGLGFERVGNSLFAYVEPENLNMNPRQDLTNFRYSYLSVFDVCGLPPKTCIDMDDIDEKFVKFLYGIPFLELYYLTKDLNISMPQIVLPPEGMIWPVARSNNSNSIIGGVCGYGRLEGYSLGARTIN